MTDTIITGEGMDDALSRCAVCGALLADDDDTVHASAWTCVEEFRRWGFVDPRAAAGLGPSDQGLEGRRPGRALGIRGARLMAGTVRMVDAAALRAAQGGYRRRRRASFGWWTLRLNHRRSWRQWFYRAHPLRPGRARQLRRSRRRCLSDLVSRILETVCL